MPSSGDERVHEIEDWFRLRGKTLQLDELIGGVVALVMPENERGGAVPAFTGPTREEAAEIAMRAFERAEASGSSGVGGRTAPSGTTSVRGIGFGWWIEFVEEPDGSFSWLARDGQGEAVQAGTGADWDDARLSAVISLYPPSGESRR